MKRNKGNDLKNRQKMRRHRPYQSKSDDLGITGDLQVYDGYKLWSEGFGLTIFVQALALASSGAARVIDYYSPAASVVEAISKSLAQQTSVAVVDSDGTFIGEISPFTLACCDESVAAAVTTLSAGDLMSYIDYGGPPEGLVSVVKARLKEKNLEKLLHKFTILTSLGSDMSASSSSDEESTTRSLNRSGKYARSSSYSARFVRKAEAIVCHPKSSLIAVMIQAIAHRVDYLWVIDDDCSLIGIVTFSNILKVFREHTEMI
ncbi:CBS domain-containing protein CBSX5-like [Vicia villosa]|uniref:CBS domain-containing protein CBSX5-like n=1 Tax=Vicia villosa TaxID=3911 RepID=UPI00273C8C21|nr:CBS domain-containing protein CBSX5-like [Vicia villosa]XP_058745787.1 CBS domain-containing protein CBSX5-like [Vicia villosa]